MPRKRSLLGGSQIFTRVMQSPRRIGHSTTPVFYDQWVRIYETGETLRTTIQFTDDLMHRGHDFRDTGSDQFTPILGLVPVYGWIGVQRYVVVIAPLVDRINDQASAGTCGRSCSHFLFQLHLEFPCSHKEVGHYFILTHPNPESGTEISGDRARPNVHSSCLPLIMIFYMTF
jgi:hypothetical protein